MEDWETWSLETLEKEMSPSRWNPNKTADQVINEYVQVSQKYTKAARSEIPNELNIPYGNKPSQQYDIYGTDLPENSLTFVWLHGGYWQEGSKDISGLHANVLHPHGIRTIAVAYTLAPNATLKEIQQETMDSLQNIINRFPRSRIVCGGHSAGAQLSAMLLHTGQEIFQMSKQIDGLLLVSGIYDLRPLIPTYVNTALNLTQPDAEASSPLRICKLHPNFVQKASTFKILLTVGKYDSPEFHRQGQSYFTFLKETFPQTVIWESPSDDHFTLVQNMADPTSPTGKNFIDFMRSFISI